jgi:hypothetical protein
MRCHVLNKAYAYVIPPPPQSLVRRFLTIHAMKTREVNPPSKLIPGIAFGKLENYLFFYAVFIYNLFIKVIRWVT